MKKYNKIMLAHKYASAFVNVFAQSLAYDDMINIEKMAHFLSENKRVLFFLNLSVLDSGVKMRGLDFLCQRFDLSPFVRKLMVLLLEHKRIFLLEEALVLVVQLYRKRFKIEVFHISSYPELSADMLQDAHYFLSHQTGNDIKYSYKVDSTLISGVRMQSDLHLWEHSIYRQLQKIRIMHN